MTEPGTHAERCRSDLARLEAEAGPRFRVIHTLGAAKSGAGARREISGKGVSVDGVAWTNPHSQLSLENRSTPNFRTHARSSSSPAPIAP